MVTIAETTTLYFKGKPSCYCVYTLLLRHMSHINGNTSKRYACLIEIYEQIKRLATAMGSLAFDTTQLPTLNTEMRDMVTHPQDSEGHSRSCATYSRKNHSSLRRHHNFTIVSY